MKKLSVVVGVWGVITKGQHERGFWLFYILLIMVVYTNLYIY